MCLLGVGKGVPRKMPLPIHYNGEMCMSVVHVASIYVYVGVYCNQSCLNQIYSVTTSVYVYKANRINAVHLVCVCVYIQWHYGMCVRGIQCVCTYVLTSTVVELLSLITGAFRSAEGLFPRPPSIRPIYTVTPARMAKIAPSTFLPLPLAPMRTISESSAARRARPACAGREGLGWWEVGIPLR